MKEYILERLRTLEDFYNMEVLFAVESGSRLWGIASNDSDWDVRFVFKQPLIEYLRVSNSPRNVITLVDEPDGSKVDFVGWDIAKYLKLAIKSNPQTLEWLKSDILYSGERFQKKLSYLLKGFRALPLYEHYRSLAKSNYKKYIEGTTTPERKKYLYVTRGTVCALYVLQNDEIPEPSMLATINGVDIIDEKVKSTMRLLVDQKIMGHELGRGERLRHLDSFFRTFFLEADDHRSQLKDSKWSGSETMLGEIADTLFLEVMGVQ